MNDLFIERTKKYFKDDYLVYLSKLNDKLTQGFFLNTNKCDRNKILSLIDFSYSKSTLTSESFYHYSDNIGKTKGFELGIIYPQEISASLSSLYLPKQDLKFVVDLCAAPGGKTINVLNRLGNDILCIANDISHERSLILSANLERLGLDNAIIANKNPNELEKQLYNFADLVVLDAPCSGEGMIRKYPEILNNYNINNISKCASIQKELLENAYNILNYDGYLLYSTCTYAFEEDEEQIINFLNRHTDMELIILPNQFSSSLYGTIKLSILNDVEGQFIALMHKNGNKKNINIKYLKTIKDNLLDAFIKDNLFLNEYYLYKNKDKFYLSLKPLLDLGNNIIKYGICIGEIKNKRIEINHNLYRANSLIGKYKHVYDLNDSEYLAYIGGNELKVSLEDAYYLITYKNLSLGYGKVSNNRLKNKYPKGLRRML